MNKVSKLAVSAAFVLASASSAYAGCGIGSGSAKLLANDFPATQAIASAATACDGGGASGGGGGTFVTLNGSLILAAGGGGGFHTCVTVAVSYTHLTLPTTPYV